MGKQKIAINAIHTKSGGGLIYLQRILPYLAQKSEEPLDVFVDEQYAFKFKDIKDITIHPVSVPNNFFCMHLWEQTVFALRLRLSGFTTVLCNANYVPFLAKKPIPIIHNNVAVMDYEKRPSHKLYWKVLEWLTKRTISRCRFAFSVAGHILPRYAKPKKLAHIFVAPPAADVQLNDSIERDLETLVAVGDIYIQKDYLVLLKAFKRLTQDRPKAKLMIIGRELDKHVASTLKAYVNEHDLKNNVIFSGFVPHEQLFPLLERATLYINTSLVECFNMPVLEALACGAPTVVFDHNFQREVAAEAAFYVPFSNNPADREDSMAKAMQEIMNDPQKRAELSDSGKMRAEAFSWQKTAEIIWNKIA